MTIRTYQTPAVFAFHEALAILKGDQPTPLPFLIHRKPEYSMESTDGLTFRIVARIEVAHVADAPEGVVALPAKVEG